jgi:hypothetical protein
MHRASSSSSVDVRAQVSQTATKTPSFLKLSKPEVGNKIYSDRPRVGFQTQEI